MARFNKDKLRMARKSRNITQAELAKRLKVTRSTVSKIEIGEREPSLKLLVAIARELDISTDYFLDLTNNPASSGKELDLNAYLSMDVFRAPGEIRKVGKYLIEIADSLEKNLK